MTAKPGEFATAKEALLWDILRDPANDGLRLVFADWCEDHGEPERAEFIRGQVLRGLDRVPGYVAGINGLWWLWEAWPAELVGRLGAWEWRRGFLDHVTLTTADFLGETCWGCGGEGKVTRFPSGQARVRRCGDCDGTGHVGGHARAIFEAHPITRVTLSDRQPYGHAHENWYDDAVYPPGNHPLSNLPTVLFSLLTHTNVADHEHRRYSRGGGMVALSAACVRYARRLVGLPEIGGGA